MDDKKRRDKNEDAFTENTENSTETQSEESVSSEENSESSVNARIQDVEEKYKRALADYQNLQRRTQEEKKEWARFSNKELLLKILPILDTLMLAEKHTQDKNFILTVQQFLSALEQEGVKKIKTIGEEFNPHTMEAVSTTEGQKNKVVDEMRAGYMYEDTVLRPAQVIVGQ